jgi:hypothetical protein
LVLCTGWLLPAAAAGQAAPADPETWTAPKTPWGDPDLQGIWDYWTFTPLERPDEFAEKDVLTEEEVAVVAAESRNAALTRDREGPASGDPGAYGQEVWTERGRATALTQPSLIVDPPSGKLPPVTPAARRREDAQRAAGGRPVRLRSRAFIADGPEDRGLAERCLLGFSTGPPMLPGGYNNNVQILQVPGYVVLFTEMVHDARIVPLDGRPHLSSEIRQWLGDARGSWDGDALVVESRNFTHKIASFSGRIGATGFVIGSAEHRRLIERFTRVGPDELLYEFTIDDPTTFARTFTGRLPMTRTDLPLYEYACHEGNYGLTNILRGARAEERAAVNR